MFKNLNTLWNLPEFLTQKGGIMKILNKLFVFTILFIILCPTSSSFALNIPKPQARVNDYADMLTVQEEAMLEKRIEEYDKSTSNQIAILTINSLEGENLEDFSVRVAQNWGVGLKSKDNGILILISKIEHKIRIEVGYGLEGAIPDGVCGRIIREEMTPNFKQNKIYEGINNAIDKIILAIKGEYKAEDDMPDRESGMLIVYLILIAFLMFISGLCGIAHFLIGGIVGGIGTFFVTWWIYNPNYLILFLAAAGGFVAGMAAKFILEGISEISDGSGFSSGGSLSDSGGFSGFGGGGFGGGGASGGW